MFQNCKDPQRGSHLRAPSEFEVGGVQAVDSRQLASLPDSAFVQASEGNGQRLFGLTPCLLARLSPDAMRRGCRRLFGEGIEVGDRQKRPTLPQPCPRCHVRVPLLCCPLHQGQDQAQQTHTERERARERERGDRETCDFARAKSTGSEPDVKFIGGVTINSTSERLFCSSTRASGEQRRRRSQLQGWPINKPSSCLRAGHLTAS